MATQQLIDLVQDEASVNVLLNLLSKYHLLDAEQQMLDIEKKSVMDDVKLLGLKPAEFHKMRKYKLNDELLMNELAFLEIINDHLM